MRFKTSHWTLIAAIIFSINSVYWYIMHPEDIIGMTLFSLSAIFFYIGTIGNIKSGN